MKGQMELTEISILAVTAVVMIVISYFLFNRITASVESTVTEEHVYARTGDVVNAFYTSKISGTNRTLAQIFADRIMLGTSSVHYGKVPGLFDVDGQVTEFFNVYYGNRWRVKAVPQTPSTITIVVDPSTNVHNINSVKKAVLPVLKSTNNKVNVFILRGDLAKASSLSETCDSFKDIRLSNFECKDISPPDCQLKGTNQGMKDWGNGISCVITKGYAADGIVIAVVDEIPGGSDVCIASGGEDIGQEQQDSLNSLLNVAKEWKIKLFFLKSFSECQTGDDVCEKCSMMFDAIIRVLAQETNGDTYPLDKISNAGDTIKEIVDRNVVRAIVLGHEIPKNKRILTYVFDIPLPSFYTKTTKIYLYVW